MSPLDLKKITDEDLERINPLTLPLPWLVVIVLVIIFLAMKYTGGSESDNTAPEAVAVFPQIYVTDVHMRQFDSNGTTHYQLTTPLIRHFQVKEKASASDYTLFETPVFILADDPTKPAWYLTAQEGRRDTNGEWFTLTKDVLARQTSPTKGELTISTEELRLNTQAEYAETNKAVTMRGAKSVITGVGLKANIKRDQVDLLSHVKGTYEP